MAAGVPVAATAAGALAELLPTPAALAPPGDAGALAARRRGARYGRRGAPAHAGLRRVARSWPAPAAVAAARCARSYAPP